MKEVTSVAVMQPYFFPYLGYWQLIHSVDVFVLFDDVNYIKKGYINKNKIINANGEMTITLPLASISQNKKINEIQFLNDKNLIKKIAQSYSKAINFKKIMPVIEELLQQSEGMLIDLLECQIKTISNLLGIETEIIKSSSLKLDAEGRDKITRTCKFLGADIYKNAIGGRLLYGSEEFNDIGLELRFIDTKEDVFTYSNGKKLSIIDFLMKVPESEWLRCLSLYEELK